MITIRPKKSFNEWFLLAVFYLLLFQSALEMVIPICKYIDEVFALIAIGGVFYSAVKTGRFVLRKRTAMILVPMMVFFFSGVLGNVIFQYQPTKAVLTDLYTNFKFFLSILSGYIVFSICDAENDRTTLLCHARMMAAVIAVFLVIDLIFHIFPSPESRYGMRVEKLFFYHPTYLAAAMVFLLSIFFAFYEPKNRPYMACALLVLFFTFRGKAMAGAAVYVLLYYFVILRRKRIQWYHATVLVLAVIFIGRDLFTFYYLDLEGESARSIITQTSFQIMKDYFPIGTGFGTYASAEAAKYYSPVYVNYGFRLIGQLDGVIETGTDFFSDTFWPIIVGQTGVIGTVCFVFIIAVLVLRVFKLRRYDINAYAAGIFIFAYLIISSTSEPAFHNSISVPLAMMIGYTFTLEKQHG